MIGRSYSRRKVTIGYYCISQTKCPLRLVLDKCQSTRSCRSRSVSHCSGWLGAWKKMTSINKDHTWDPRLGLKFGTKICPPDNTRPLVGVQQLGASKRSNHTDDAKNDEQLTSAKEPPANHKPLHKDKITDTGLSFQIPDDVLQKAIGSQNSEEDRVYWNYSLYTDAKKRKITVHYCRKLEASERIAKLFLSNKLVGFDLEWNVTLWGKSTLKDCVSLIQLASEDRIALFHIALHRGSSAEEILPPTIKKIMESADITKTGVAILGDCSRLKKHFGVEARSIFELSHLHKLVKHCQGHPIKADRRLVSLATQVEEHLLLPLSKDPDVRSGEWSKELDMTKITYAASDAYASVRLYHVLEQKRKALVPTPPLPQHAELGLPIRISDEGSSDSSILISEDEEEESEEEGIVSEDGNEVLVSRTEKRTSAINTIQAKPRRKKGAASSTEVKVEQRETTAEVLLADAWVEDFRRVLPTGSSKFPPSWLRAYSLWHQQSLDVSDIANLLRNPPLKNATVAQYILDAIRLGKLPYDQARIEPLLQHIPKLVAKSRYSSISGSKSS